MGGRSELPEAILARLEPHVSPITGVIRSLEESNDGGYVTAVAAQTFPMYRYNFQVLHDNLLSRSGGKGLDPVSARATAVARRSNGLAAFGRAKRREPWRRRGGTLATR